MILIAKSICRQYYCMPLAVSVLLQLGPDRAGVVLTLGGGRGGEGNYCCNKTNVVDTPEAKVTIPTHLSTAPLSDFKPLTIFT